MNNTETIEIQEARSGSLKRMVRHPVRLNTSGPTVTLMLQCLSAGHFIAPRPTNAATAPTSPQSNSASLSHENILRPNPAHWLVRPRPALALQPLAVGWRGGDA